jgi:hypothetical protein
VPTRQHIVRRDNGRYYLDCEFEPYKVTVEINGAQHIEMLSKESGAGRGPTAGSTGGPASPLTTPRPATSADQPGDHCN